MNKTNDKLWGGRFSKATNELVENFNASISFDKILAPYDIKASIAHVSMLSECKIIQKNEAQQIIQGLHKISDEITNNVFSFSQSLEDIHMNIESRLIEIVGSVGKKVHTARSRNDQIATDLRLYLRDKNDAIILQINLLQQELLNLAAKHTETIMPGFTHLQSAQVVSFAHHLMAYYEMLARDKQRLNDARKRINIMPLGSAALAGTSYPINREITRKLLGFDAISHNSIDAVSDRDFIIEFLHAAAIIMMHLSRFSEEIILWSSTQFNFVELSDAFATGSSIMPQKKNPDIPELVRGKTGRVYGSLISLLTIMKAQPLAYNKDNQEDKEGLFDSVSTLLQSLTIFTSMLKGLTINTENMKNSAIKGYTTATDMADYLVTKGESFRDAHNIVGNIVAYAIKQQKDLAELSLKDLQQFSPLIDNSVFSVLNIADSMCAKNHLGGTAPSQVLKQINKHRQH